MTDVAIEKATAVSIEGVVIKSPLNPITIDIKKVVIDLDVFEHLDKPYTTAVLSFVDGDNIMSSLNVSGAESVTITLKANTKIAVAVETEYYISRVITSSKANETNELVVLHLTEKVNYLSGLQNVNKAYSGKPTTIMAKIAKEYLDTEVRVTKEPSNNTKIIVPNLTPLDALSWIKNKLSTEKGYPYYMFSYLGGQSLFLVDLNTMLSNPAVNRGKPYTFSESAIPATTDSYDETSRRRVILDYQVKNTEDLYSIIDRGLIGATHQYIDVTENTTHQVKHDMHSTVVETLVSDNLLQSGPLYSNKYKLGNKPYNEIQSRNISQIMSSQAFEDVNSYNQSDSKGQYKLNSIQRAMDALLKKQPMDIIVNGIDFLQLEGNSTIGNKLEVKFPANLNNEGDKTIFFDTKKSGEYLIYAAKHSFGGEDYRLALSCVKLSNGEV